MDWQEFDAVKALGLTGYTLSLLFVLAIALM